MPPINTLIECPLCGSYDVKARYWDDGSQQDFYDCQDCNHEFPMKEIA